MPCFIEQRVHPSLTSDMRAILTFCGVTPGVIHVLSESVLFMEISGLFVDRVTSRGSDQVRVTRPRPVRPENLLTRLDPTREIDTTP